MRHAKHKKTEYNKNMKKNTYTAQFKSKVVIEFLGGANTPGGTGHAEWAVKAISGKGSGSFQKGPIGTRKDVGGKKTKKIALLQQKKLAGSLWNGIGLKNMTKSLGRRACSALNFSTCQTIDAPNGYYCVISGPKSQQALPRRICAATVGHCPILGVGARRAAGFDKDYQVW